MRLTQGDFKMNANRKNWIWFLAVVCGLWTLTSLTACNTTEGVGEDMQEAGEEIEDAAD
jgi:predicted small secreted protein